MGFSWLHSTSPCHQSASVYNLLEVWFLDQFLKFRTILPFVQIIGLVYLLPVERDPFTSDINFLVLHTHHSRVEFFYYIYETKGLVLKKEKPSSLLNNFLEGEDPLAETSFAYGISMLQFVCHGNISQLSNQIAYFFLTVLCSSFFSSPFLLSCFFNWFL